MCEDGKFCCCCRYKTALMFLGIFNIVVGFLNVTFCKLYFTESGTIIVIDKVAHSAATSFLVMTLVTGIIAIASGALLLVGYFKHIKILVIISFVLGIILIILSFFTIFIPIINIYFQIIVFKYFKTQM